MSSAISEIEARLALSSIERRRQQVLVEIGIPTWYWLVVAGSWVVLGVPADFGLDWATTVGTILFGAAHSAIAPRVISGRRPSPQLSINPTW
jgi:hypothetical protein